MRPRSSDPGLVRGVDDESERLAGDGGTLAPGFPRQCRLSSLARPPTERLIVGAMQVQLTRTMLLSYSGIERC